MKKGNLSLEQMKKLYEEVSRHEAENTFTNGYGDQMLLVDDKIIFVKAKRKKVKSHGN